MLLRVVRCKVIAGVARVSSERIDHFLDFRQQQLAVVKHQGRSNVSRGGNNWVRNILTALRQLELAAAIDLVGSIGTVGKPRVNLDRRSAGRVRVSREEHTLQR